MYKLTLQTPIVVSPAVVANELTIERIVDIPQQKVVRVFVRELSNPVTLWEGADYDAAGDWTQTQAEARILEVLS